MNGHGGGNGDKALFGGNGQRYADRVPAAEHERHGRLFHARDQLSDGKSGFHIAADRVEQNQQTVDFVGLLNCCNLRDEVLVLGGFVLCGKFHVALDLADNGDAVYRSARCSCRNRAGFRDGILFRCGNGRGFFGHR